MNKYLYIFLVFCFAITNSIYSFGGSIMQLVALFIIFVMSLSRGVERVNFATLAFAACCLLSIMLNNIPDYFRPWARFGQYGLLLLAVSPLIGSYKIDSLRMLTLEIVTLALSIIAVGSFFFYLAGMGMTIVGYFGLAQHPNFLGFFAMISNISLLSLLYLFEQKKKKIVVGVLLLASMAITMLSAARICLAGSAVGMFMLTYFWFKDRLGKLLKIAVLTLGIGFGAYPVYQPYVEPYLAGVMAKQASSEEAESSTSSRDAIWATRFEEIRRYPVTGVGCFSVDTSIESDDTYYNPYNTVTGSVELGSTFLGVMSQTGILGFFFFALVLLTAMVKCWKAIRQTDSIIPIWLFSLFGAVCIHMVVEGYATTAGSMQCLFLWLLVAAMMVPVDVMEDEEDRLVEVLQMEEEEEEDDEDDEDEDDDD